MLLSSHTHFEHSNLAKNFGTKIGSRILFLGFEYFTADYFSDLSIYVEAAIDFPEEEIDFLADGHILQLLIAVQKELKEVVREAGQGAITMKTTNYMHQISHFTMQHIFTSSVSAKEKKQIKKKSN